MIITRLFIDNLYGFENFELDLTYPRKNSKSLIEFEYLEEVPQFKFKRVCILMGTNASGKTSLGKVLWEIQKIINTGNLRISDNLISAICDKDKNAQITIEFLAPESQRFHFFHIEFNKSGILTNLDFAYTELKNNDTNKTATSRLKSQLNKYSTLSIDEKITNFLSFFQYKIIPFYYVFAENHTNDLGISGNYLKNNLDKLTNILQTFDSSIVHVRPLTTMNNEEIIFEGYTVFFKNGDSIKVTDNGETFTTRGQNRFSKGTYDVLSIADFLFSILDNKNNTCTYFLDEKLASSHSELEISILNLIIQKLNKYSQFFYTTHNYDVLDLNLPAHSFAFLHKEFGYCSVEQPEKLGFSKNDRNLKGYVRNNYFRTVPSTNNLDSLMWETDDE